MTRLRVLHCRQGDRVWGPERQILQLAQHLPGVGIEMEIILLRRWGLDAEPHPLAVQARAAGCRVFEVPARPRDLPATLSILRRRLAHCDLLHTHEFKSDLIGWVAARSLGRPWLATDHHLATDNDWRLRLFAVADRLALPHARAVIVPSYSQAQRLARHIPQHRIHTVYHGIDAAAFAASAATERTRQRSRLDVGERQPVVSLFGRLEPIKGHSDLLQAAQIMLASRPDLQFWIVGEGSLAASLQAQARQLGIEGAVRFLGYQHDVASLMAASDVVVLPSRHESFGIVLIEAMSLGKPIVASTAGSIPEVMLDGVHGYLVPPHHIEALSQRVLHLIANPLLAEQMGQAGRESVRQVFTVQKMVERLAAIYRQTSARGGALALESGIEPPRLFPLSHL
jgi:glycosyltransferase involved in cell wall biosynthesis